MNEEFKSNVKIVNIKIPKLDYKVIPFSITRGGEKIKLADDDTLVMTVCKIDSDNEVGEKFIFQKKLGNGIEYDEDTGNYNIEINSEDTENMAVGQNYGYDITIFYEQTKPSQKVIGEFKVGEKYSKFSITEVQEGEADGN